MRIRHCSPSASIRVAPSGAGEETLQRVVHNVSGSPDPPSRDHQLNNEPVMFQGKLGGLEMDMVPSAGGAIGNLYPPFGPGPRHALGRAVAQGSIRPTRGWPADAGPRRP
ncbi:DUF2219 family protein [Stutzerimonas stutzeri]|nr:DUF2219 family protein [Stutzerimonas stutzeri]